MIQQRILKRCCANLLALLFLAHWSWAFLGLSSASTFKSISSTTTSSLFVTTHQTVVVAGATGYIGKAVVAESVKRGYHTVALVRDLSNVQNNPDSYQAFKGATVMECNVCNAAQVEHAFQQIVENGQNVVIQAVISCLASRSGGKKDVYEIDYQASLNCLESGQAVNAQQYILLSAFCVRKPELEFQRAKLKMEAALQEQSDLIYSIVRPTAFHKSVSAQFESIKADQKCILFGGGEIAQCNPIAERDLAEYMLNCIMDPTKHNQIVNVGGPGPAVTHKAYNTMMFQALGKEPKFVAVPVTIFDILTTMVQTLAWLSRSQKLQDAAETIRILKYYATESMLTTDPSEIYGTVMLEEYYQKIAEFGQEFDPYVSVLAKPPPTASENSSNRISNAPNMTIVSQ